MYIFSGSFIMRTRIHDNFNEIIIFFRNLLQYVPANFSYLRDDKHNKQRSFDIYYEKLNGLEWS